MLELGLFAFCCRVINPENCGVLVSAIQRQEGVA